LCLVATRSRDHEPGHRRVVLVSGEAGNGKTTLVEHGYPYEQALALAESGDVASLEQAVRLLTASVHPSRPRPVADAIYPVVEGA
jgi:hypothetical protein